ncbi:MAG: glutamate racemase [Muribaculaceae bacterium]|nr:glutamate racemase [Muribaculaceae bacterium]
MKKNVTMTSSGPIGIFDSGYGGLTILKAIREQLPEYDYLYLGDNARAPYGTRSFDIIYRFTLEGVRELFDRGCRLVILACNTASAKALRTIQQRDLPTIDPTRRVLGVIRPTVEALSCSATGNVGILGTVGTIASRSYEMEIAKLYPLYKTTTRACPLWVPLVENAETDGDGARFFVDKYINALFNDNPAVDTIVLGCTHYPLLLPLIEKAVDGRARILTQGDIVAASLADYLHRHPEIESRCSKTGEITYLTTENPEKFSNLARVFLDTDINVHHIDISQ